MVVLVLTQNIMKQRVSIIDTYVVSALHRMIRLVLQLQMSVKKNIKKQVELGMTTVHHKGHTETVSLNQIPLANQRTSTYWNSKADSFRGRSSVLLSVIVTNLWSRIIPMLWL